MVHYSGYEDFVFGVGQVSVLCGAAKFSSTTDKKDLVTCRGCLVITSSQEVL